jgi:hypothetical protein
MAYIPTTDYYQGNTGETEEERRRRLEQQAADARADAESTSADRMGSVQPVAPGIFEQAFNNRINRVGERFDTALNQFVNPGQTFVDRASQPDAANTEVHSQQVKTYADGSQEQVVKTQMPAPIAPIAPVAPVTPEALAQPVMAAPQSMAAATVMSDQQRQAAVERLQAAQQAQQPQPAQQAQPVVAAAPAAAQLPADMIGQGVQLAGPVVPGTVAAKPAYGPVVTAAQLGSQSFPMTAAPAVPVAPAATAVPPAPSPVAVAEGAQALLAAAPNEAAWIREANAAQGDFNKLLDIAARYPESRQAIQDQLKSGFQKQTMSDDAQKILEAASKGDPKALNKLELALRPSTGKQKEEVTTKDYLQAYLYSRLGLTELAANAQQKILGQTTKFGQIQLDGTNWTAEYNRNTGELVRAKDDEGNVATENTLNKLSAASMKLGTHVYAFTGEPSIVHEKDGSIAEVRQRTNAITGAIENVYVTGPRSGEKYTGTEVPMAKSVLTSAAKMDYGVISGYRKAFGEDLIKAMDQARRDGVIKTPEDQAAFLDKWKFSSGMPGVGAAKNVVETAPPAVAAPSAAVPPPAAAVVPAPAPAVVPAPAAKPAAAAVVPAPAPRASSSLPVVTSVPGINLAGAPPERGANEGEDQFKRRYDTWKATNENNLAIAKAAAEAKIQKQKELEVAEAKPPATAKGENVAKDINNQNFADQSYDLIKPISDIIKQTTGSGLGTSVDKLAAYFGKSTEGAAAIAKLEPLVYPLVANVPRFSGSTSDYDIKMYQKAAGDFADSTKPVETRLAALQGMVQLLKKYDKDNKHDWTFSNVATGTEKTINGITYVYDGRGWKKK